MKKTMHPAIEDLAAGFSATVNLPTEVIGFDSCVDAMVPMVGEHQSLSAFATDPDVLQQVFGLPVTHANQLRLKFL